MLASLDRPAALETGDARIFRQFDRSPVHPTRDLVASQAINWGNDPLARRLFLRDPKTREAQSTLRKMDGDRVFFSGEALYTGPDMGTVEAALGSGAETAQRILADDLSGWSPAFYTKSQGHRLQVRTGLTAGGRRIRTLRPTMSRHIEKRLS
jgi:hypothetical protein